MLSPFTDGLLTILRRHAPDGAADWLSAQLANLPVSPASRADLLVAFASAGRRFGTAPLVIDDAARALIGAPSAPLLDGRGLDELARVALLLAAVGDGADDAGVPLLAELFYRGETREKQAVLRALPLMPAGARLVDVAVEACRSSVQPVFEAIACESPYPADHFPTSAFNQMVLKALFNDVAVTRIVGLERRVEAELVRMCGDYASERRAAGRSVPDGIRHIGELFRRKP